MNDGNATGETSKVKLTLKTRVTEIERSKNGTEKTGIIRKRK